MRGKHVKNRSLGPGELKRQPRWRVVKPNPPGLPHPDPCPAQIGIFCGHASGSSDAWWWKNYGSGWAPAAFYRDSLGTVHLRGLIAVEYLGGLPQAIFRLPAGYRPEDHLVFAANRDRTSFNGGATEVDVRADGIVEWNYDDAESVPPAWVSLSGISFRPD